MGGKGHGGKGIIGNLQQIMPTETYYAHDSNNQGLTYSICWLVFDAGQPLDPKEDGLLNTMLWLADIFCFPKKDS